MLTFPFLTAASGCAPLAEPPAPPPDQDAVRVAQSADVGSTMQAVETYLANLPANFGYTVGTFAFVPCPENTTCDYNNPATPYGRYCFQTGSGACESAADYTYTLGAEDAIIWYGQLPSDFTYMSFRSYLGDADGVTESASLGDSTNERTSSGNGEGVSLQAGQYAVVVTTPDNGTFADVVAAFNSTAGGTFPYPITIDGINPNMQGVDLAEDTLNELVRIECNGNSTCESYANGLGPPPDNDSSEYGLIHIHPNVTQTPSPYDTTPFTPSGGTIEPVVLGSASITNWFAQWFSHNDSAGPETFAQTDYKNYGNYCIPNGTNCKGDNRDAVYAYTPSGGYHFTEGDGDIFVVWGANHTLYSNTVYSSVTIYNDHYEVGIAPSATSPCPANGGPCLTGSAEPVCGVPDASCTSDQEANDYIVVFARSCSSSQSWWLTGLTCVEVPSTLQPEPEWGYVPNGYGLSFFERAYLNPNGASPVRPPLADLQIPNVIHFYN
jgi:hypothetical protein